MTQNVKHMSSLMTGGCWWESISEGFKFNSTTVCSCFRSLIYIQDIISPSSFHDSKRFQCVPVQFSSYSSSSVSMTHWFSHAYKQSSWLLKLVNFEPAICLKTSTWAAANFQKTNLLFFWALNLSPQYGNMILVNRHLVLTGANWP